MILVPDEFRSSADELADYRRGDGLVVLVTDIQQVYNEFAGGHPDMRAIRDYFRFLYDRVEDKSDPRALDYALLFGDGHYDFRRITDDENSPILTNWIPPFETRETLYRQASYTSDDYFGLLDDDEGEWVWAGYATRSPEAIDIGVGRLPVNSIEEAQVVVAKIKRYESAEALGSWRTRYTFVADDGPAGSGNDKDLHTQNADIVADEVSRFNPEVNLNKVYAISYPVESTVVGRRIPGAKGDLLDAIRDGTLVWNYSGHGGWEGLADERLLILEDIDELDNFDRLTTFITATCSFGAFDKNRQQSGAERLLTNPNGGAIALMTTVRLVVTWDNPNAYNLGLNLELNRHLFERDESGLPLRLGDAMLRTKTSPVGLQGNNRKFNLLGDPTMRMGLPTRQVTLDKINGADVTTSEFQLQALGPVRLEGRVLQPDGQPDLAYNGIVDVEVFDAERTVRIPRELQQHLVGGEYALQSDLIYRGKASVTNGSYSAAFVVPKDISYSNQPGRVGLYTQNAEVDGIGVSTNIVIGGTADNQVTDNEGPEMEIFVGDTSFVDGGSVKPEPELIVRFFDESGINTIGTGVGHEMIVVIDGDEENAIDIGDRFEGTLDSYQRGTVRFRMPALAEGPHSVRVRAWDVVNNSSTSEASFVVLPDEGLKVTNLYNYPNPMLMGRPTVFAFEHNQPPGTEAEMELRIYTVSGRLIRRLDSFDTLPTGALSGGVVKFEYDGLDQELRALSRGVYLYKLKLELQNSFEETTYVEQIGRLAVIG